ncbi:MAG: hypothetical protein K9G01_04415 [Candidatus Planktophila sp.]|nr:hypothetical protein [Candidatus Planktophila sp.]
MRRSGRSTFAFKFFVFSTVALTGFAHQASAATLDSVSHIHHVKVVGSKVLVLTHEGLYELAGKNNMKLVGKEKIDVMGFASLGNVLIASGHPAAGSKMPNPIGVMKSLDGGLTWKPISLVGKVDFHFLEGAGSDLYGADSQTGKLLYSADSGKTWRDIGVNTFADIAVSPKISGMAIAIKDSELLLTEQAFKSTTKIKSTLKSTQIEWLKSGLYGLSGSSLYKSTNSGKTWKKLSTFKGVPGILSASDQLMLVTVGSDIYTSNNEGKSFRKIS